MTEKLSGNRPQTIPEAARNGPSHTLSSTTQLRFAVDDLTVCSIQFGEYAGSSPPPTFGDMGHVQGGSLVGFAFRLNAAWNSGLNQFTGAATYQLSPFDLVPVARNMWAALFDSLSPASGDAPIVCLGPWPCSA